MIMKKIRTFLALVLSAVLMLTAVPVMSFADEGDALTFDTAEEIEVDETVEGEITDYSSRYYKISCKSEGLLTVKLTSKMEMSDWFLFDEDGAQMPLEDINIKAGVNNFSAKKGDEHIKVGWNSVSHKATAELTYKVKKGDYYVAVNRFLWGDKGTEYSFSVDLKKDSEKEFSYLGITLKKGATMQLEAVDAKDAKWTSSKKTVATVSSTGKIKAKKKGTTIITCTCGDVVVKLKVTVK